MSIEKIQNLITNAPNTALWWNGNKDKLKSNQMFWRM